MTTPSRWIVLSAATALLSAPDFVSADRIAALREPRITAVPSITALTPQSIYAGVAGFRLTVDGSQFEPTAQVRWNGAQRPTTFVSATRLTATISLQDVSAAGSAQVTVVNPNTGGGTSNPMVLSIVNPVASIASLSPTTAPLLGEDFALTVLGAGFVQASVVHLNGAAKPTTFVTSGRVVGRIHAGDLTAPGNVTITVVNPAPGGGTSPPATLPIRLLTPSVSAIAPSMREVGLGAFTLRVSGSNFVRTSVARWNGAIRPTTFLTPTDVAVAVTAADVDQVGSAEVSVMSTAPNVEAEVSNATRFFIASARPVVSGPPAPHPALRLQPADFTFTGSNFLPQMSVQVNGVGLRTTPISSTRVRVRLDSIALAQTGSITLRFANPFPTMGATLFAVDVVNPAPVIASISPQNVFVRSRDTTITVTGSRFVPGTLVRANGAMRPTTFLSTTQLRAALRSADLASGGDLPISVVSPTPGGGTSGVLNLVRLEQQIIVKD